MIHVMPHWNFEGLEGELIKVWVYTNCDEVELFLNGKSLGRKAIEKYGHGQWLVEYEQGTLEAIGFVGGERVCSDKQVTTGRATALKLRLDNQVTKANGVDIAVITCCCVDENGNEVPNATSEVSFCTNGMGFIVGTGSSPADHIPVHATQRRMYAGRITAAVHVGKESGILKVYATSDNLKSAVLDIALGADGME